MTITTRKLQDNLKHCIGRKTVYFENGTLYHYGTPILRVKGNKIYLTSAFDYSASTSRVRNVAIRLLTEGTNIPTTAELRAARRNYEVIGYGGYMFFFESWED